MREKEFPSGWDEKRVKRVILHYQYRKQTDRNYPVQCGQQ
jgi:hypothetical protein